MSRGAGFVLEKKRFIHTGHRQSRLRSRTTGAQVAEGNNGPAGASDTRGPG
jgi:hypothetical protein